jgi:transcriptional regulator with XRE-family HTH domain
MAFHGRAKGVKINKTGLSGPGNTMKCLTKQRLLANHLRRYRKARGLSQRQAARILGYANSSRLSKWEHGSCLPNSRNLFRLAAAYRTLVDALYIDVLRDIREEVRGREAKILKQDRHAA